MRLCSFVLLIGIIFIWPINAFGFENIYNIQVGSFNANTATIIWKTAASQTSKVEYGTTTSYGSTVTDGNSVTEHSLVISGLIPGTTYHYRVSDMAGTTISTDQTFVMPYEFGIITGDPTTGVDTSHSSDELAKGIKVKTLELAWDQYETADDTWNSAYIADKQAELAAYETAGFSVVLDLGVHYSPAWVRSIDSHALFKNQYGDTYAPDEAGKNIANVVFNKTVRTKLSEYINKVFSDLGMDFYAVRAGGLWFGELHYPSEDYNSRTNAFWGYDANAQGTNSNLPDGVNVNPVPDWIPNPVANGTFENGVDGKWLLGGAMDTITASDAHRGSYSLKMNNPGSFTNVVQQNVEVVSGRTYRYSFWAKTSDPDTSTPPCLQITTTGGTEIVSPQCAYSTSYQQVTGTFTPNVDSVRMNLLTYASEDGVILTFDDVSLMESSYSYDATHADATAFWEWYRDSLTNYQNWQIDQYRDAGYNGNIYMLYPGYGLRNLADTNWTDQSISYDLSRTTVANTGGHIQYGEDWQSQIDGLPSDDKVFAYSTWLDGDGTDASANKGDWSPAKYLAHVAGLDNRGLYGENTGSGDSSVMQSTIDKLIANNYLGLYWFNESQLYGGTYATAADYAGHITNRDQTIPYNGSVSINNNAQNTTLSLAATDNVTSQNQLEMMVSNAADFSGASYESFAATKSWTLASDNGLQTVYVRFRDGQDNVSNTLLANVTLSSGGGGDSSNNNSSSSSNNTPPAPSCNSSAPTGNTNLFQIDVNANQSIIYFAPASGSITGYNVYFGLKPDQYQYSAIVNSGSSGGVLSYKVNSLQPNTNYYFRVQPMNGCASGAKSNEMSVKTLNSGNRGGKTFYKDFPSRLLSIFPRKVTALTATNSVSNTTAAGGTLDGCHYQVQAGDSLWEIAAAFFGKGNLFGQLMSQNGLTSSLIQTGQTLKVGC